MPEPRRHLSVRNVSLSFGGLQALHEVNLTAPVWLTQAMLPLLRAAASQLFLALRPDDIARITCRIHEGQVKVVCEPEASKKTPANG